ncbi:hypothetical protein SEMRO_146_G067510.1 [Seminavis robusta]|uniref:Uncharacterized protein n=1 Tax=Seminavis robusta TaxID=568900 RepID=A0A9N8H820_9STRA|nr:hypothetical protein SEMRO_146_G067510.1 [Seminavis robusta]|eukprot:Sro146_g067510.1 n/a (267) ;mRNA; f:35768-36568
MSASIRVGSTSSSNNSTSDATGTLQEALFWNNEGVKHLAGASARGGGNQQAMKCFYRTVHSVIRLSELTDVGNGDSVPFSQQVVFKQVHIASMPKLHDQCFYTFNHAFTIEHVHTGAIVDHYSVSLISTVALFNLALAFHLTGMLSNNKSKLFQAQHFYRLCMDVMGGGGGGQVENYNAMAVVGGLALNNQAQIAWHMFGACQTPQNHIHQLMDALKAKRDLLLHAANSQQRMDQCGAIVLDLAIVGEILFNLAILSTFSKLAGAA